MAARLFQAEPFPVGFLADSRRVDAGRLSLSGGLRRGGGGGGECAREQHLKC